MRATLTAVVVLLAAGLLLGGCGGGGDEADSPATTATPSETTQPSETATSAEFSVESALLSLADMPVGWTEDRALDGPNPICGYLFSADATEVVTAQYSEGGNLPFVNNRVGRFEAGGARAALDGLEDVLTTCREYEAEGYEFTIGRANLPTFGDESVAVFQSVEGQGFQVSGYAVAIRVGDGITYVTYGDSGTPSVEEATRFAKLATYKLRAAQR